MFQYIIIVGLAADGYTSSLVVKQKAVDVTPLSFTLYIAVRVVILYYWFAHLDIRVKMKTFDDSDHAAVFLRSLLDRSYLTVTLHRCVGDGVSCKRTYPIAQSLRRELGWRRDRSSPALNFFFSVITACIDSQYVHPEPPFQNVLHRHRTHHRPTRLRQARMFDAASLASGDKRAHPSRYSLRRSLLGQDFLSTCRRTLSLARRTSRRNTLPNSLTARSPHSRAPMVSSSSRRRPSHVTVSFHRSYMPSTHRTR